MSNPDDNGRSPVTMGIPTRGLTLGELVREVPDAVLCDEGAADIRITGVHQDSRRVASGDLFVARSGLRTHGLAHLADAEAKGAAALLVERGTPVASKALPRIEADDVPKALAYAAAAVYGHPTFGLDVVGITGTNGKTTTAHLVRAMVDASGDRCGVIGTIGHSFADLNLTASHTSPEADEIARIAAAMRQRGATHLAMEVSSIALIQKRVEAVRFRVAAFTNLTQDHLDFHGSMEAYAEAKERLFFELGPGSAAINVSNAYGRTLANRILQGGGAPRMPLARFSALRGEGSDSAEIAPVELEETRAGISLLARTPVGTVHIRSKLVGAHNVENLLTALTIGYLLEIDVALAADALSNAPLVPGRLERCDDPKTDDVVTLVDYAHTPDALERVLRSVRPLVAPGGRLWCVFGCGGDRDPKKRPLMGRAAGELSDIAVITNDNPRSEAPEAIADAIRQGIDGTNAKVIVELDRAKAIDMAIREAGAFDVVLLAGKGHEPYQIIGGQTHPFDDRVEARRALAARRVGGAQR